jgi:hypothetical protein
MARKKKKKKNMFKFFNNNLLEMGEIIDLISISLYSINKTIVYY